VTAASKVVRYDFTINAIVASSADVYTSAILRCKMLAGNSQTLELHPLDAGFAFFQNALLALRQSA